ncbi:Porphobilinogen deaminase [compost metagenome]
MLAAAGLERLGLGARISSLLDAADSLPAAGQGALGIEIRDDRGDMRAWLAPLVSADTTACVLAERAVSRKLGGSCQVPLAAFAQIAGGTLTLRALVASPDGARMVHATRSGPVSAAEAIGEAAADELLQAGAQAILRDLLQDSGPG